MCIMKLSHKSIISYILVSKKTKKTKKNHENYKKTIHKKHTNNRL